MNLCVCKDMTVYLQAIWFLHLFQLLTDHLVVVLNQTQALPASVMCLFQFFIFLHLPSKVTRLVYFPLKPKSSFRQECSDELLNCSSPLTHLFFIYFLFRAEALKPDRHKQDGHSMTSTLTQQVRRRKRLAFTKQVNGAAELQPNQYTNLCRHTLF